MLEIFVGRLKPDLPIAAQQLILTGIDCSADDALDRAIRWIDQIAAYATVVTTSSISSTQISQRGQRWSQLMGRLSTLEINIPALSARRQDIAPLALQALSEACRQAERAQLTLASDTLQQLEAFSWPDNLRQLKQSMVEAVRSAVLSSAVQPNHLPVAIRTFASSIASDTASSVEPIDLDDVLVELEKVMLRRAIRLSPRNRAQAARLLGISRPRFLRRIIQLGIVESSPNLIEDDDETQENEEKK
ncbi:MAG: helix-turn-helix domain-containing protein [Pirellulales bacterium]